MEFKVGDYVRIKPNHLGYTPDSHRPYCCDNRLALILDVDDNRLRPFILQVRMDNIILRYCDYDVTELNPMEKLAIELED